VKISSASCISYSK